MSGDDEEIACLEARESGGLVADHNTTERATFYARLEEDLRSLPDPPIEWQRVFWQRLAESTPRKVHRRRIVRTIAAFGSLAAVSVLAFIVVRRLSGDGEVKRPVIVGIGAAPRISRDDIVALSKFGFVSIDANAKTTIYVDNVRYGETPITRLPLQPGPHMVRAFGPKGRKKEWTIAIIGGRDTAEAKINW